MPCDDPYGEQQMVTALIFAHDRWGSTTGPVNYEAGAVALLDVMRHKEDENGGIVDGITNTFDSTTALPYHLPVHGVAGRRAPVDRDAGVLRSVGAGDRRSVLDACRGRRAQLLEEVGAPG